MFDYPGKTLLKYGAYKALNAIGFDVLDINELVEHSWHANYPNSRMSKQVAMKVSAFNACTRVLAETLGIVPLNVYRLTSKGRMPNTRHSLYKVLVHRPAPGWDPYNWREFGQTCLILDGNFYCEILRKNGKIVGLLPLLPSDVEPEAHPKYGKVFRVEGKRRKMLPTEIFHVAYMPDTSMCGRSLLTDTREVLNLSKAINDYSFYTFKNGAKPSGVLLSPTKVREGTKAKLQKSWDEMTSGSNAGGTAVLEYGLDWKQISMKPADAEVFAAKRFQIQEIGRMFRMQLHKIGDLENATYTNISEQNTEFLVDTVEPWLSRWEAALMSLLPDQELGSTEIDFNVQKLLRTDAKSLAELLAIEREKGIINANEWRIQRGYEIRTDPEADEYWKQPNKMKQTGSGNRDQRKDR